MRKKIYIPIKRIMDFIISLIGLIILLPIFLCLALIIKLESKGPIIFKQKRVGKIKNILKY